MRGDKLARFSRGLGENLTGNREGVPILLAFNIALAETDIKNIMADGLAQTLGLTAVSTKGKLATSWGNIKQQ